MFFGGFDVLKEQSKTTSKGYKRREVEASIRNIVQWSGREKVGPI